MEKRRYSYTLQKISPKDNQYRFYTVRVTPSLFDEWTLIREWGRIGSSGTLRNDIFPTEDAAFQKMEAIIKAKTKKGYQIK